MAIAAAAGMAVWSIAASLARPSSRLAPAAADAVLCLCIAEFWLLFAGALVLDVARIAGAEGGALAVAASRVVSFCDDYFLYAFVFITVLFLNRLEKYDADEQKGPLPRLVKAGWNEVKCSTVMVGCYACVPFMLLMLVGGLLMVDSPVKGSRREAIAFAVYCVGRLGKDALVCFVIIPTAALKVWMVTRPSWRIDTTVEAQSLAC